MRRLGLGLVAFLWLAGTAGAAPGLHVAGHRLLDGAGHTVTLRGVNRSGTEYACIQGWGIFDGPSDAASIRAITSWHVNFVRVGYVQALLGTDAANVADCCS